MQVEAFEGAPWPSFRRERRVVGLASGGLEENAALRLAAAVEQDAEHPVGRAIVATAKERGLDLPPASGFTAIPGFGAEAMVGGRRLTVGGPNLITRLGVALVPQVQGFTSQAATRGEGVVYLIEGDQVLASFAMADAVRPESAEAVARLHELGLRVAMLTGDAQAVADAVASQLGIDTVFAEVLPDAKAARIEALQRQGRRVAMVGDGVNDAPALVTADVGIAIGAGTDVAVEAGDVVLVRNDARDIPRIVGLSRATYRKMVQNLWWATGYNIVAIPLAAGVLAPVGILQSPAMGAVLMSISTVIVAINAQLLRRTRLQFEILPGAPGPRCGLVVVNDRFMYGSATTRYCHFGMRRFLGLIALILVGSLAGPTRAYASESHCRAAAERQAPAVQGQQGDAASATLPASGQSEAPCRSCHMPGCPSALCPVASVLKPASGLERLAIAHVIPAAGEQRSAPSRSPQPPTPPPNHSQFLA